MLDDVEELPEDDERVVVGLGTEAVCGLARLLEHHVGECGKPVMVERLSSPLRNAGVWPGALERLSGDGRRGELREAVDLTDVGDGGLRRLRER